MNRSVSNRLIRVSAGIVLGIFVFVCTFWYGGQVAAGSLRPVDYQQATATAAPAASTVTCTTLVNVFLLSGPGNATLYNIVGSLTVGQDVTVLGGNSEFGFHTYYKVLAANGRQGWLPAIFCPVTGDPAIEFVRFPLPFTPTAGLSQETLPGTPTEAPRTPRPQKKVTVTTTSVAPPTVVPPATPQVTTTPAGPPTPTPSPISPSTVLPPVTTTATATSVGETPTPSATPTPTLISPATVVDPTTPTATPTSVVMPPEPSATPTTTPPATPTKRPRSNACVRIDFEVSGDEAARGLYLVRETGGKHLAAWYALDGWQDSGWIKEIDITHENVYVQVLYYRGPGVEPVEMKIVNHAPDSPYGWMSFGVCHALEVAWPGEKPAGAVAK